MHFEVPNFSLKSQSDAIEIRLFRLRLFQSSTLSTHRTHKERIQGVDGPEQNRCRLETGLPVSIACH